MAEFSGKIVEARYTDVEYTIVEVLYRGDDKNTYSYALRANPESQDWIDLIADGWDQDKLIEQTIAYKRAASNAWNEQVNAAASALIDQLLAQKSDTQSEFDVLSLAQLSNLNAEEYEKRQEAEAYGYDIYNFIMDKNLDKDELFKFKMWALDLDFVKSKDTETKSALRKVQSILDGLTMINNLK